MPRRKVGDPKKLILEAVGTGGAWSEIQRKTGLSKAALSKHLREMIKMGLLRREVDTAKTPPRVYYRKTQSLKISELSTFPQVKITLDAGKTIFRGKLETLYEVAQGKALFDTLIIFDEEKREMLDKIAEFLNSVSERDYPKTSLRHIANLFIGLLQEGMCEAYGVKDWQGWEQEPFPFLKIIEQKKKLLDFEATLVLHFNGKELLRQIDWEQGIKQFEELDRHARECWRIFTTTVAKNFSARFHWLVDKTIEEARKVESAGAQKFLAAAFNTKIKEITEDMWATFSTPEKAKNALVDEVRNSIYGAMVEGLTGKPIGEVGCELTGQQKHALEEAGAQVEKVISELVEEGVLEFTPIYLPRLNKAKANKKQREAKACYPSPTEYLNPEQEEWIEDTL